MGAYGDHLEYLATQQAYRAIDRISNLVDRIDARTERMERTMATLNEALTGIAGAVTGLEEDVDRLIAAVANEDLSPEAQAAVDAIQSRLASLNALSDTAVPPPPVT